MIYLTPETALLINAVMSAHNINMIFPNSKIMLAGHTLWLVITTFTLLNGHKYYVVQHCNSLRTIKKYPTSISFDELSDHMKDHHALLSQTNTTHWPNSTFMLQKKIIQSVEAKIITNDPGCKAQAFMILKILSELEKQECSTFSGKQKNLELSCRNFFENLMRRHRVALTQKDLDYKIENGYTLMQAFATMLLINFLLSLPILLEKILFKDEVNDVGRVTISQNIQAHQHQE